ncbi:hypothetical protein CDEF62S_03694 [Castellaniella defragrans]
MGEVAQVQTVTAVDRAELAWWSALAGPRDSASFLSAWLALQAEQIPHLRQAALVLGAPDAGPFETVARHPADSQPSAPLYEVLNESLQNGEVAVRRATDRLILAYPILLAGHLRGVAAFETLPQAPEPLIQQVRWGLGVLESSLLQAEAHAESQTVERLMTVVDSVARSLKQGRFEDVALSLVTDLAVRLDCDRVSFGLRHHERCRVHALSHSSKFVQSMNLMRAVAEAMDEAIDQNATLCLSRDRSRSLRLQAHEALAREFGNGDVLTVPFTPDERGRGALVFECPQGRSFDAEQIELCQSVTLLAGRALYQHQQRERPFWKRGWDTLRREAGWLVGTRHIGRKLALLAVVAVVLFGALATGPYRVDASATVQGVIQRSLTIPFDGYIASSLHRAGDVVHQGEALATLDTRETQLELLRASNQQVQYQGQAEEAMAQGNSAAAAIARAQARQAVAQMHFYQDQMARAVVRAPFDGILVSGDLSQRLGEAVKRGQEVFKISPMDQYRLWLDVRDSEVESVHVGQTGHVALAAMPDRRVGFTVQRIVPLAQAQEGKSVFRVEAGLSDPGVARQLRPGMEGVGKIDVGTRHYLWIWTHPFVDWLRLKWWAWFG